MPQPLTSPEVNRPGPSSSSPWNATRELPTGLTIGKRGTRWFILDEDGSAIREASDEVSLDHAKCLYVEDDIGITELEFLLAHVLSRQENSRRQQVTSTSSDGDEVDSLQELKRLYIDGVIGLAELEARLETVLAGS